MSFFNLPHELQTYIYRFDSTYHSILNGVFHEIKCLNAHRYFYYNKGKLCCFYITPKNIETFLEKHGMQGVKYIPGQIHKPKGWTREELKQESNYVIYDAKLLEIVRKNLGIVAAPSIILTAKSMPNDNEEGI